MRDFYQMIVNATLHHFEYPNEVRVRVRDTIRGNAYYKSQTITMPKFLFTDETEFFTKRKALKMNYYFNIYYAIHEACHLKLRGNCNAETMLLNLRW